MPRKHSKSASPWKRPAQVYLQMKEGKWYTCHDLNTNRAVMKFLIKEGLVEQQLKDVDGNLKYPENGTKYRRLV